MAGRGSVLEAARNTANVGVEIRMHEETDRHAAALRVAGVGDHHPVQGRNPSVVGPTLHHVAEIDHKVPRLRQHRGPAAVRSPGLEPALALGHGEYRHRAEIGMRTSSKLAWLGVGL